MIHIHRIITVAAPTVAKSFSHWVRHLGALGFIPLGLIDSSVIPLPGSMDVLLIVLSAHQQKLWFYFAIVASIGSVLGSYVTYRIARNGGKEALERRFSRAKITRVNDMFARWGFGAIAISALLPPPMPFVPFLFAAGAMQYSVGKFLAALALGRSVRYGLLAFFAARYGRHALVLITRNEHPILLVSLGLMAVGIGIFFFWRYNKRTPNQPA